MIEKAPEITACEAMIVATEAKRHQRVEAPFGRQAVERVLERGRIAEQQRALPEIIQQQRRKDEREAKPVRSARAAEMPHIGVERLGPGHREKDRAQHDEAAPGRIDEQRDTRRAG